MKLKIVLLGFVLTLAPQVIGAQKAKPKSRLVTSKIIYVAPMPGQLDQWIIQDLRAWGKYQVSGNSEGVDLVLRAQTPPEEVHYTQSEHLPVRRHASKKPAVLAFTIVNWVTGEKLWEAQVLNRSRKKDTHSSPGPKTEIYARKMNPDQVAERCVTLLREYVTQISRQ